VGLSDDEEDQMNEHTQSSPVVERTDEWVEVRAEVGDGIGRPAPIKVRPGGTATRILLTLRDDEIGRELEIGDLEEALDQARSRQVGDGRSHREPSA
jgi:hypothetical protein